MATVVALSATSAGQAAGTWRFEDDLPRPIGGLFSVPLGEPADLKCWSPTRCLLLTEGTSVFPSGLFYYNGASWRQFSTVCGPGDSSFGRIVWAGPSEFWTITAPSLPWRGEGLSLCNFAVKSGPAIEVIGSYSRPPTSADPYLKMVAGTCVAANDCWFGGVGGATPDGSRVGAFHLRWDGVSLSTVYAPSGRGVSDLEAFGGQVFESVFMGPASNATWAPDPPDPPGPPALFRRIGPGGFVSDDFRPREVTAAPLDRRLSATEVLALDGDADGLWAAGGGARSGVGATSDDPIDRGPFVARLRDSAWSEIEMPPGMFDPNALFTDISAMPSTDSAWAVVRPDRLPPSGTGPATVALIGADGSVAVERLPAGGTGRGSAAKIDCPAADDCWLATTAGWLFHYTDGAAVIPEIGGPFATVVTYRPNEAIEQAITDDPPVDDSLLFAPLIPDVEPPKPDPTTKSVKSPVRRVRGKLVGTTLKLRFIVTRKARVGLVARRKRRVVAKVKPRWLRHGRHTFRLKLNPKRWPTKLAFSIVEPGQRPPADPNVVTVPTGDATTPAATTSRMPRAPVRCSLLPTGVPCA